GGQCRRRGGAGLSQGAGRRALAARGPGGAAGESSGHPLDGQPGRAQLRAGPHGRGGAQALRRRRGRPRDLLVAGDPRQRAGDRAPHQCAPASRRGGAVGGRGLRARVGPREPGRSPPDARPPPAALLHARARRVPPPAPARAARRGCRRARRAHLPGGGWPRPRADEVRGARARALSRRARLRGRQGYRRRRLGGPPRPPAPGGGRHGRGRPPHRPGHGLAGRGTRDRLSRVRLHEGVRRADGGGQGSRPRGHRAAGGSGGAGPGAVRRAGAERGAPLHQSALPAHAHRDPRDHGSVGREAHMAAGKIVDASASVSSEARRRHAKERRKAKGDGRWGGGGKGTLALALAGFALGALYPFDPMRHPLDQSSPVGPVGLWMGWAAFWAFGYAGYVFPLLLILYGAGAFVHAPLARGWRGWAGLVLLLVSATGMLARASDTLAELRIHKGGMLGWAVNQALSFSIGSVGTWIILLAILPVAALFITQASLGKAGRALRERWTAWKTGTGSTNRLDPGQHAKGHVDSKDEIDVAPVERAFTPPPLTVKEPAKPKSTLAEKGLAWQETFDFGSGGAQSFQLPPVGLLQAP